MRDRFFFWLVLLIFNSMFFGAAMARLADGGAPDWFGLIGSFLISMVSACFMSVDRRQPQEQSC